MNREDRLCSALAYLEKLPPAISGSGGHNATFAAALACKRFGLSEAEALTAMQAFNARCRPPWSERELRHKIASAYGLSIHKPLGRRQHSTRRAVFTPPVRPAAPPADPRPVCQQPAAAEELWWARAAIERGTTLEVFDRQCGVTP